MAVTLISLFGEGDRMVSQIKLTGPTSYTQVTVGTPPAGPTGGQIITATAFGLKYINTCHGALDESGKYFVIPCVGPGAAAQVTLIWVIAHTGAEETGATNLSTFTAKFRATGR
jgi:hypothetical protein